MPTKPLKPLYTRFTYVCSSTFVCENNTSKICACKNFSLKYNSLAMWYDNDINRSGEFRQLMIFV